MKHREQLQENETGFVLATLVITMVPMLIAVLAFSSAMNGKSGELRTVLTEELALLASESGIDDAIHRGRIGTLAHGATYFRDLGSGQAFLVEPTHLLVDGLDNDNDSLVDEEDEDVFQVVVTGTYRTATRRLAAYLGPVPLLPTLTSGVASFSTGVTISLVGTAEISGINTNMDGTPVGSGDVNGLTAVPPGTVAHLLSELTGPEKNKVVGIGPNPSVGLSATFDLTELVDQVKNSANLVLTSSVYNSYNFGNGLLGITNITYREGDVKFTGNGQGAGILLVTGNLTVTGTWRFDGVIIVLGSFDNSSGTAVVYGSLIQGPNSNLFTGKGNLQIQYSAQAIDLANKGSGRYVSFNGWQEISRK